MEGKTLEQLHAEWFAARDELHAFEQRLGVLLQEMSDKEVPAPDLRSSQNVEKLQRLVEEESGSQLPTGPLNSTSLRGRPQTSLDSVGRRRRRQDVASGLSLWPAPAMREAPNAPQWASESRSRL